MADDVHLSPEHDECLETVKRYIDDNTGEPLSRDVLASVVGYSVPHFHRIFTAGVGENIADYVRRVRLERAGRKLRMGAVDITEVALAAGYQSHAAFTKAFKIRFGLSPAEFRELDCWAATRLLRETPAKNSPN
jgi:AraC family transcriptional regulator